MSLQRLTDGYWVITLIPAFLGIIPSQLCTDPCTLRRWVLESPKSIRSLEKTNCKRHGKKLQCHGYSINAMQLVYWQVATGQHNGALISIRSQLVNQSLCDQDRISNIVVFLLWLKKQEIVMWSSSDKFNRSAKRINL